MPRCDVKDSEDRIIGWVWQEKAFYCTAHKPSAPDDEDCVAVIASDYNGEECDDCGEKLEDSQ
jgi:hypothetical protein